MTQPQHNSNSQSDNQQQSRETTLRQWYDNLTPEARAIRQALEMLGFGLTTTGGNCTAFAMEVHEPMIIRGLGEEIPARFGVEILLTNGEPEAPSAMSDQCFLTLFDAQSHNPIITTQYPTMRDFFQHVRKQERAQC